MLEFVEPVEFYSDWKNLGLDDEDLRQLQSILIENPEAGDLITATGGARKIRYGGKQSGKRGGTRIIYAYFKDREAVALFIAYGKKEKDDLNAADKKALKELIGDIKKVTPFKGKKYGKGK
jgi:mRNA-degrading endonuclease RelE of RelBE toxin-antitoxin system